MNQSAKRNLLRFMKEEAENVKKVIIEAERLWRKDEEKRLAALITEIYKDIQTIAPKLAKKHGLTFNKDSGFYPHIYGTSFKEYNKIHDHANIANARMNKIDDKYRMVERDILLGVEEEASDILTGFVMAIKAI